MPTVRVLKARKKTENDMVKPLRKIKQEIDLKEPMSMAFAMDVLLKKIETDK